MHFLISRQRLQRQHVFSDPKSRGGKVDAALHSANLELKSLDSLSLFIVHFTRRRSLDNRDIPLPSIF